MAPALHRRAPRTARNRGRILARRREGCHDRTGGERGPFFVRRGTRIRSPEGAEMAGTRTARGRFSGQRRPESARRRRADRRYGEKEWPWAGSEGRAAPRRGHVRSVPGTPRTAASDITAPPGDPKKKRKRNVPSPNGGVGHHGPAGIRPKPGVRRTTRPGSPRPSSHPPSRDRRGASPSCSGIERPHRDLARMATRNAGAMLDEQRTVAVDPARPPLDRRSPRQHAHGPAA